MLSALLVGNIIGAFVAVHTTRAMKSPLLAFALRTFLVVVGVLLVYEAFVHLPHAAVGTSWPSLALAGGLGTGIGWISGAFGVAGDALRIPLLIFAFDVPIKLAGTISVIVSLPRVPTALGKHVKNGNVPRATWPWIALLGLGSVRDAIYGV